MKKFSDNIIRIKKESNKWSKIHNARKQDQLKEVEEKLKEIYSLNNFVTFLEEEFWDVRECELKCVELLKK